MHARQTNFSKEMVETLNESLLRSDTNKISDLILRTITLHILRFHDISLYLVFFSHDTQKNQFLKEKFEAYKKKQESQIH